MKAKRADFELVLPARDPEAGLVLVSLGNAKLMVRRGQVQLGEEPGAVCLVNQLVYVWKRLH